MAESDLAIRLSDLPTLTHKIGSSRQTTVYRAQWNSRDVAIKKRHVISSWDRSEVELMMTLSHPNIITFYGAACGTNVPDVYIVTELAVNGSLKDVYRQEFKLEQKMDWAKQVAEGMRYLHQQSILHKNLKPENVLFTADWTAKLCDLSIARKVELQGDDQSGYEDYGSTWIAPEMVENEPASFSSDVFAYGMTLWQLITREEPFSDTLAIMRSIRIAGGHRPDIPDSCEPYLADLIKRCWDQDPKVRPTFEQILSVLNGKETLQSHPSIGD